MIRRCLSDSKQTRHEWCLTTEKPLKHSLQCCFRFLVNHYRIYGFILYSCSCFFIEFGRLPYTLGIIRLWLVSIFVGFCQISQPRGRFDGMRSCRMSYQVHCGRCLPGIPRVCWSINSIKYDLGVSISIGLSIIQIIKLGSPNLWKLPYYIVVRCCKYHRPQVIGVVNQLS